jgi:hypothetical protein
MRGRYADTERAQRRHKSAFIFFSRWGKLAKKAYFLEAFLEQNSDKCKKLRVYQLNKPYNILKLSKEM